MGGTDGHGHGLPGSRIVGRIEFEVMILIYSLTRRVGRDELGRGGYERTRIYYYFKFEKYQITHYNSKKLQKIRKIAK
jgi:hypothetical protein